MKTNALSFFLVAFLATVFCPTAFSDNPPKKEQDGDQKTTTRVFTTPYAAQNENGNILILSEGDYVVTVFDEQNVLLYWEYGHFDAFTVIPNITGFKIDIQEITPNDLSNNILQ